MKRVILGSAPDTDISKDLPISLVLIPGQRPGAFIINFSAYLGKDKQGMPLYQALTTKEFSETLQPSGNYELTIWDFFNSSGERVAGQRTFLLPDGLSSSD